MKAIQLEERAYNATELKEIFNNNKQTLSYENYYKEIKTFSFVLLDQSKPVLISGYPYGHLRTFVKYWIESNRYGETLVFQSQNPKTMVWNKPKKSGYSDLGFMVINSDGHISITALSYNDGESKNKVYQDMLLENMSDKQKIVYAKISGYTETMKHVTFNVRSRLFKNRITGEISESVNVFDLKNVDECDEEGNLIDKEAEELKKKKDNEILNKDMQYNAVMKFQEIKKVV